MRKDALHATVTTRAQQTHSSATSNAHHDNGGITFCYDRKTKHLIIVEGAPRSRLMQEHKLLVAL